MPSQTFTHTATANAPVGEVWEALDRPETWEAIGGVHRVFDPKFDEGGRLRGFSFDTVAAGRKYVGRATPHQRDEGHVMAWNVENSEVRGVTSVELEHVESSTSVTVTLEVESRGLLSGIFFPVIAATIGNGLPAAVDSFVAEFSG